MTSDLGWDRNGPERFFVLAGGRRSSDSGLDLVSLVVAREEAAPGMQPEHAAILTLLNAEPDSPMTVADLSAELHFPASTVMSLVAHMRDEQLVMVRALAQQAHLPHSDPDLLEAIISGLRKRL